MSAADGFLHVFGVGLHHAVAGSHSHSQREQEEAECYQQVFDALFPDVDHCFSDSEESHHHKHIIGHLRMLHHSDRAVKHHQGDTPAIFLPEDQIEAAYHRRHHSERQRLCFVSRRNDQEEVRGHGHCDRAHYAQPFVDPESPHHYEETQEIAQQKRKDAVREKSREFSEKGVHSPHDLGHGSAGVLHRDLVAGHAAEHGVRPVRGSLCRLVVLLEFVGHSLPLKGVALTQDLTLDHRPAVSDGQSQEHHSRNQVGAVFFEKLFHLFIFAIQSAGLAHR